MTRPCSLADCPRPHYARGWCERHYRRWQRTGSPADRPPGPAACTVPTCDRPAEARGWCHGHYLRWRRTGEVSPSLPLRPKRRPTCEVPTCERGSHARGLCRAHYKRLLATGSARPDAPLREVTGRGHEHHGYRKVPVEPPERHLTGGITPYPEHRLVMARMLGRPLHPSESVHHLNGDRLDNRAENLELWDCSQPSGQRVEDKVAFAVALLARYRPDLLRQPTRNT